MPRLANAAHADFASSRSFDDPRDPLSFSSRALLALDQAGEDLVERGPLLTGRRDLTAVLLHGRDDVRRRGSRVIHGDPQAARAQLADVADDGQALQEFAVEQAGGLDIDDVAAHRQSPQVVGRRQARSGGPLR